MDDLLGPVEITPVCQVCDSLGHALEEGVELGRELVVGCCRGLRAHRVLEVKCDLDIQVAI